jgi:hypothetical protein
MHIEIKGLLGIKPKNWFREESFIYPTSCSPNLFFLILVLLICGVLWGYPNNDKYGKNDV